MNNDDLTVLLLSVLCLIGAIVAIRYQQFARRRYYRQPSERASRAGTTPPSRPDQLGAPLPMPNTARQREPRPTGLRPGSHSNSKSTEPRKSAPAR